MVVQVTDETFEEQVLGSDVAALVDFWAEWCGPCKSIAKILEEAEQEYEGKLKVFKLDVDGNKKSPERYGIRGIPTLIIFKNGNRVATQVGALTKSQLVAFIAQAI